MKFGFGLTSLLAGLAALAAFVIFAQLARADEELQIGSSYYTLMPVTRQIGTGVMEYGLRPTVVDRPIVIEKPVVIQRTEKVYEKEVITERSVQRSPRIARHTVTYRPMPVTRRRVAYRYTNLPRSVAPTSSRITERTVETVVEKPVTVERSVIVEKPVPVEKVIERPVIVERPVVIERPVVVEKPAVIERPVMIERVVEKPVIMERPVEVERVVEKPIIVKQRVHRHHLMHLGIPLIHLNVF